MIIFAEKKFTHPIKILKAFDKKSFVSAFEEIEKLRKKYYIAGYVRYEAKDIFLGKQIQKDYPLLYFEVFENYKNYSPVAAPLPAFITHKAMIDFNEYSYALNQIKELIAQGETYQVNYTYDSELISSIEGEDLYSSVLNSQTTPYNFYNKNEYEEILSFSPELFFEINGSKIKTKPMKGTVCRGNNEQEDINNIEFLKNDTKNRAENVMIVDLLRNDLGKIAKFGTVQVEKLFEIETHKTVHQMTSEITAELKPNITMYDIFEAIFPCGSITGAPKISTMRIIDRLETGERDIYCGAIGLISPEKAVFSVPIRILRKRNNEQSYRCRAGGAIVWDSDTKDEWDETKVKLKFLTPKDFKIIETAKVLNGKILFAQEHISRMKNSAAALGFLFNEEIPLIIPEKDGMIRILLKRNGEYEVEYHPINQDSSNVVKISNTQVNSKDIFLKHKTTFRPYFEEAMKKIKTGAVYDELFFNEKGELTEGARSNIVVKKDGVLYTPPLECGLLNGVGRSSIISKCREKILSIEFLKNADSIFCINSVRGLKEVVLDDSDR